jgi:hypothetical protein
MDDELVRALHRWHDAEERERDEDADLAFGQVYRTVLQEQPVSSTFAARTMEAVAEATAADARRARRTRHVLVPAGVAAAIAVAYFSASFVMAALSTTVVDLVNLLVGGIVSLATSLQRGADVWTVISGLARATTAFIGNPAVTITMLVIQAIAVTALIALQRLLGSTGGSIR